MDNELEFYVKVGVGWCLFHKKGTPAPASILLVISYCRFLNIMIFCNKGYRATSDKPNRLCPVDIEMWKVPRKHIFYQGLILFQKEFTLRSKTDEDCNKYSAATSVLGSAVCGDGLVRLKPS